MSALERLIRARIAREGPMPVSDYMALCLGHPGHGYYVTRDPLGAAGDFTTAPEISQMFGELIGAWLVAAWQQAGAPAPVRLVELGPGRGTLMQDAMRVIGRTPLAAAAGLWLVETSPPLRAEQARRLPMARWADRLEEVPAGPLLLVANEFLDALPVRQFLRGPAGWHERQVGLVGGRLAWGLSPPLPAPDGALPGQDWAETCAPAAAVAAQVAARIGADGGAALFVDYGYRAPDRPAGPTLQAVRGHAPADPLADPGGADLTWLVDFDRLARDLAPLAVHHAAQGAFLGRLGIGQRAAQLARARPDEAGAIADALERLTAPDAMGRLFRVLAAVAPGAPVPPGFEPGFEEAE